MPRNLLASVDAHQIAGGVAGVNAAVGKDGDGPAAALQDWGFSGGVESLGGGWAQGEIAGFTQDEQMVLHGHQGAAEIAIFTPLHGAVDPA